MSHNSATLDGEIALARRTPDAYKSESTFGSLLYLLLSNFFISVFIIFGKKKTFGDWLGFLVGLLLEALFLTALVYMLKVSFSKMRAKRKWRKTAIVTRSAVVDIRTVPIEDNENYGDVIGYTWQVGIRISPEQPVVWADVKKVHYEDYARRRTALVYQSPDDPLTFLLEDEL